MPPYPVFGSLAPTSLLTPGTVALSQACAGAGRRGGQSRRSGEEGRPRECSPLPLPLPLPALDDIFDGLSKCCAHSRENLKLKAR
jgi:hypothetical protein